LQFSLQAVSPETFGYTLVCINWNEFLSSRISFILGVSCQKGEGVPVLN